MADEPSSPPAPEAPAVIRSALEPDEPVEAIFRMRGGLEIYATDRRFFGRRGEKLIAVDYGEVAGVTHRRSRGIARGALGLLFAAAGVLTGFETATAAAISLLLLLIGGAFLFLGLFLRDHWVELRIQRKDPRPSFGHVLMFFPFWLLLHHGRRYAATGSPEQVDALCEFLRRRLPANRPEKQ